MENLVNHLVSQIIFEKKLFNHLFSQIIWEKNYSIIYLVK